MEDLKKKLNTLEEERSAVNKELDESKTEAIELIREALKEGKKKEELLAMGFLKEYIEEVEGTENLPDSGGFRAPDEKVEPNHEDKKKFLEMIEKIKSNKINIDKLKEELSLLQQEKLDAEKNNINTITTIEPEEKKVVEVPKSEPGKETKKENIEELNSQKLKIEVEKVIKSFANTLEEKGVVYKSLDIESKGDSFHIVAHLAGTGLKRIAIGKPKFIADIKSRDGKIIVPHNELEASGVVKTFVKQEAIDKFANTIGDEIKKYIEKSRGKEVERIDIENGVLKITYK